MNGLLQAALPALGELSALEWILLAVIAALCVSACIFIHRMKKRGQHVPGRMCAGCPDACTIGRESDDAPKEN